MKKMTTVEKCTAVVVTALPPAIKIDDRPAHYVGNPPTAFQNPWASFISHSPLKVLQTRFSKDRNFVPVPPRDELVAIRKPDWGHAKTGLKSTWIGHASFLVETTANNEGTRGVRALFDPVWSERTSPVTFAGPKRYTPPPCPLSEIPDVDLVVISHNHYDHLDVDTILALYRRRSGHIHFFCALGNASWFVGAGIPRDAVTELDWWHGVRVDVPGAGSIHLTCTPSQHFSGRSLWYLPGSTLWCSWVLEEVPPSATDAALPAPTPASISRKLFFAGDTGYRSIPASHPTPNAHASDPTLPHCPAFADIGARFGPFDLALLPIGLYSPRVMLSPVHCSPEDSLCIHRDVRSKRSIGMHWGTVRGGISAQFEDVREPPRRWREAAEREGLWASGECALCEVGETVVVE
ncbi:hypothetical protein MMC18_004250 [Xylographa bjoerkii]|nr:hypothetical protein [Xylographa bjoerkii]